MTWHALYCISGQEFSIRDELRSLDIETFFPYERFKRHKNVNGKAVSVHWIEVPLFPNYLFTNTENLSRAKSVRGVLSVVSAGLKPLTIPDRVISAIRRLAEPDGLVQQLDMTKNSFWFSGKVGDKFRFKGKTPLAGLIGEIISLSKLDANGEVLALVEMLGQAVEVRLKHSEVGPILQAA